RWLRGTASGKRDIVQIEIGPPGGVVRAIPIEAKIRDARRGHAGEIIGTVRRKTAGGCVDGSSIDQRPGCSVGAVVKIQIVGTVGFSRSIKLKLNLRIFARVDGKLGIGRGAGGDWPVLGPAIEQQRSGRTARSCVDLFGKALAHGSGCGGDVTGL